MQKFGRIFFTFITLLIILHFVPKVSAQPEVVFPTSEPELLYNLPYPGILPDHPLYPLKRLRDAVMLLLSRDSVRSIELKRLFADKHLVMAQLLWEKENYPLAYDTLIKGERYLLASGIEIEKLKTVGQLPPGLSDMVELAAKKHIDVITKIIAYSSEEKKRTMLNEAMMISNQAMDHITTE